MAPTCRPRRPLVPLAIAFLCGVASADAEVGPHWACAGFAVLLGVAARPGGTRTILGIAVLGAAAMAGSLHGQFAWVRAESRVEGWLPKDGAAIEGTFVGKVVRAPERADGGERYLIVRGVVGPDAAGRSVTISVRVPPAPAGVTTVDGARRGDGVRMWCRLRRPYPAGNPGARDPRRVLLAQGIDAVATVKSEALIERTDGKSLGPGCMLDRFRAACRERLDEALGREGTVRAVAGAMMLGDQRAIEQDTWRRLRDGGLVHIVSVSGLHLALLVGALVGGARALGFGERGALALALPMIAALAFVTGGSAPVLRAALMGGVGALGHALGRRGDPLNTLAASALLLVGFRPFLLLDIGFQLSHAATAGLVGLGPVVSRCIPAPRWVARALGASVGAYVATVPLAAWHFGKLAPAALLANLAAAALCAGVLGSAGIAALLSDVPGVGTLSARLVEAAVGSLLRVSDLAAAMPGGSIRVPSPGGVSLALCAGLLALALAGGPRHRWRGPVASGALALALLAIHVGPPPSKPDSRLCVDVIDVGQGLSVALRGAGGEFVLVDCGGSAGGRFDAGERLVVPWLTRSGCRRVSALVLSHGHDDHAGGAESVIREIEVGALWVPAGSLREPAIRKAVDAARTRGCALVAVASGWGGTVGGIPVEVLHPPARRDGGSGNEWCLVLRAGAAPFRVLVPADLEGSEESDLARRSGPRLRSEALLVGHHGSDRATSERFLDAVRPSVAVISVGARNRFGHPAPSVLSRLEKRAIPVYRTDRDGLVRLWGEARGGFRVTLANGSEAE